MVCKTTMILLVLISLVYLNGKALLGGVTQVETPQVS